MVTTPTTTTKTTTTMMIMMDRDGGGDGGGDGPGWKADRQEARTAGRQQRRQGDTPTATPAAPQPPLSPTHMKLIAAATCSAKSILSAVVMCSGTLAGAAADNLRSSCSAAAASAPRLGTITSSGW